MDNMEYIDDYFKSSPGEEQKKEFEQRIVNDISFAEEVAFYLSANGIIHKQLQEEKKQRFRELYDQRKVIPITRRPVKTIIRYLAAASVVAAVILTTLFLSGDKTSSRQLADQYIQGRYQILPVTMGIQDSLQAGIGLFNKGNVKEALNQFEAILKNDPANDEAKRYAGIAALRLAQYDKALSHFSSLAADTLASNPGKWFEAVTLLKRNNPGDVAAAKKLLQEVVAEDLEGNTEAKQWLQKL